MITVLIADDQQLVRAGFRVLVDSADDMEVVGEAANGREAVDIAGATHPDVVLMDIRMPEMNGIDATAEICNDPGLETTRVLILKTFDIDDYVYAALRAGASGFLLKDTAPVELLAAIRVIAAGEALLAPTVTRRLIGESAARTESAAVAPRQLDTLTDREREVVALVAHGLSNQEITEELYISPKTAKTHVSRSMLKLQARDRAQLVVIAYRTGLVKAHPPE
jgi:DNA-binding NarL/FixJ family response regulator